MTRLAALAALLPAAALAGVMEDAGGWSDEVLREMCRTYTDAPPLVWRPPEDSIEDETARIQREWQEARDRNAVETVSGVVVGASEGHPSRPGAAQGHHPPGAGPRPQSPPAETATPVTLPLSAMLLAAAVGLLWRMKWGAQ